MSSEQPISWKCLGRKPGSNYRQLFVVGRNIAARTLYGLTFPGDDWPGWTPQEIAADYGLPLEAVEEAIAYCASEPPEIRTDWEMEEALMRATGMDASGQKHLPAVQTLSPSDREEIVR